MENSLTIEKLMEAYDKIPKIDRSKIIDKMIISTDTNKVILEGLRKRRESDYSLRSIPIHVSDYLDPTKVYVVFQDGSVVYFDANELLDSIK